MSVPDGTIAPPHAAPPASVGASSSRSAGAWLETWKGLALLYVLFAGAYLGASGGRLRQHSAYNHYVYLAEGNVAEAREAAKNIGKASSYHRELMQACTAASDASSNRRSRGNLPGPPVGT